MKRENQETSDGGGKGKMEMEDQPDAGVDELLAALGYKVRSSEMADVAQKLEQLENAMGSSAANDDALLAHLADDTNHYNPSDLSGWLESMLSEINIPPPPLPLPQPQHLNNNFDFGNLTECSTITTIDFPPANFKPITSALSEQTETAVSRKRMRTSSSSSCSVTMGSMPAAMEVSSMLAPVAADTQAAGIRLVQLLMACAEAVQQENLDAAMLLVNQIPTLAASQGGAMRKVAGFFADALLRRVYRQLPQPDCSVDSAFTDILHMHFYESCPYLKFAHFTANQAILEAFAGCRRVHVIDFAMKQGMQWPALMQALALRPGGPPSFRLTGIGPPQADNTDALQQVGHNLAKLAHAIHVDFEYRGFVANSLADLEPFMLESPAPPAGEEPEVIAVNSVFELHRLLARPSGIGKVLAMVRALRPRIMTVVEQEANHNAVDFIDRFTEALHYYSTMFDSLEGDGGDAAAPEQLNDRMMTDVYLGRQIMNVIGCEGAERTERHETLSQWRGRLTRAGFDPVHLGSNAFKQASTLLALFAGGEGYKVEENEGCLTLGWHTRPLIATSAWRVASTSSSAGSR